LFVLKSRTETDAREEDSAGIVAKVLILVTDCHSQEMGQLRVAEIEANAQLIWGTCCPAFPDQFRWFGLQPSLWLMRLIKNAGAGESHQEKLPVLRSNSLWQKP
jgi:hypothetical protein